MRTPIGMEELTVSRSPCLLRVWMLVSWITLARASGIVDKPAGRYIVRYDDPTIVYQGLMASFGSQLPDSTLFNVLLPPYGTALDLCEFPVFNATEIEMIRLRQETEEASGTSQRIALLVPAGGYCTTETKARNLLRMQTEYSSQLQALILYETNYKYADWFLSLAPDTDNISTEFDKIAMIYLPYRHSLDMLRTMNNRSRKSRGQQQPYLFCPESANWTFGHVIEGSWTPIGVDELNNSKNTSSQSYSPSENYDWIRYVLFSLLILSPCFRAGYLFYTGGGRLRWRRNEAGRITGIQYIPPMPYWLSSGRPPQVREPVSMALTEEQFKSLPEIIYVPVENEEVTEAVEVAESETDSVSDDVPGDPELDDDPPSDPELGNKSTLDTPETPKLQDGMTPRTSSTVQVDPRTETCSEPALSTNALTSPSNICADCQPADANGQPASDTAVTRFFDSRCTECSICIDDFEAGERLIVLPRCQHVFHKDCIRPWLLERQGRCPLCKSNVLADDPQETDSDQSSTSNSDSRS